jgi:hypothetical protein
MTTRELNIGLAAVVTTVADVGDAPEGVLYAALMAKGYTLDGLLLILGVLAQAGMITRAGDVATITGRGRELAAKINAYQAA